MLRDSGEDLIFVVLVAALLDREDDVKSVHDQQHLRFRRGRRTLARRVMGQYPRV
jgi:hypothetical protein